MLFTFCFLLSVFLFSIFFPHCENNCLFGGAYLVLVGNYLLLFIYAVYFLFTSFRFFVFYFFFPAARTNPTKVVDKGGNFD